MAPSHSSGYRADIDGLRAIAVLAVVLFHLSPTSLRGGYVGVDIFFVISGYLITAQIRAALEQGRFSFVEFYAKRIRRLYPALLVTLLLTWIAGYFTLFPAEMVHVSKAMIAAVFYVPNIYFYYTVDYFSENSIRPLLHTWSLGVEEQFYLIFPALLVLFARIPVRRAALAIAGLAVCSLIYAEVLVKQDASAAFYGSPTRFWEFAVGALLTFIPAAPLRHKLASASALVGVAAVIGSIWLMSETSSVPGLITLVPVLGTALAIQAGRTPNAASQALGLQPLRYFGSISYALYLVHWPLIVITKAVFELSLSRFTEAALLAGSVVLAHLLTQYVERPARRIPLPSRKKIVFAFGGASTLAVAMIGASTISLDGFAWRYPADARQIVAYLDYDARAAFRSGTCLVNAEAEREDNEFDVALCVGSPEQSHNRILLIGDSFAAQYYQPLSRAFPELAVAQVTATGCRPLLYATGSERCASLMRQAYSRIIPQRRFAAVVLAGRWREGDVPQLARTAEYLAAHAGKVYVFGPMVEYDQPLPRLLAMERMDTSTRDLVEESRHLERAWSLDARLKSAVGNLGPEVRYISVLDQLCDRDDCRTLTPSGVPAQFDYAHLTYEGAALIIESLQRRGRLRTIRNLAREES